MKNAMIIILTLCMAGFLQADVVTYVEDFNTNGDLVSNYPGWTASGATSAAGTVTDGVLVSSSANSWEKSGSVLLTLSAEQITGGRSTLFNVSAEPLQFTSQITGTTGSAGGHNIGMIIGNAYCIWFPLLGSGGWGTGSPMRILDLSDASFMTNLADNEGMGFTVAQNGTAGPFDTVSVTIVANGADYDLTFEYDAAATGSGVDYTRDVTLTSVQVGQLDRVGLGATGLGGSPAFAVDAITVRFAGLSTVTPVNVSNPSFENWSSTGDWVNSNAVDDWSGLTGSNSEGAQENSATASSNPENFTDGIDGTRFGFVNSGSDDQYLYQNLAVNYLSGMSYTLTVGVGRRLDHDLLSIAGAHWQISLHDANDSAMLAALDGTFSQGQGGAFTDQTLEYISGPADAGREIQIRLWALNSAGFAQADFDNVRLSYYTAGNLRPVVTAGDDQAVYQNQHGNTLQLNGAVTDDGKPEAGQLTVQWQMIDGPAAVVYDPNEFVTNPTVTFTTYGDYTFELTADDGQLSASDTVVIAYEAIGCDTIIPGDWNADCTVNLDDLSIMLEMWLSQ